MDHGANTGKVTRPQAARERPRRAAEDLRETRERLARGNTIKPEFEYEMMSIFVRNELSAAVTITGLSAIFSLASMFWAPVQQAILWLFLVIASKVLQLEFCRRFQQTPSSEIDIKLWRRRLLFSELLSGVTWAGFALVGIGAQIGGVPDPMFSSHVFLFAALIVVLAIRMTFASTVIPILYAGTIPMTGRSRSWPSASTSTSSSWPVASTVQRWQCLSSAPRRTRLSPSSKKKNHSPTKRGGVRKRPTRPSRASSPP